MTISLKHLALSLNCTVSLWAHIMVFCCHFSNIPWNPVYFSPSSKAVPVQILSLQRFPEGQPKDPRGLCPSQTLWQHPLPWPTPAALSHAPASVQIAPDHRRRQPRVRERPDWRDVAVWNLMLSWQQKIQTVMFIAIFTSKGLGWLRLLKKMF